MSLARDAERSPAATGACPSLGLADDPATRALYPTGAHRCYHTARALPIDGEHQVRLCLTDAYERCPLWQQPDLIRPTRRGSSVRIAAFAGMGALALALAAAAAFYLVDGRPTRTLTREQIPTVIERPTVASAATPSVGGTAIVGSASAAVPVATPSAAVATPAPIRVPAEVYRYTVREGDTLDAIAAFFGAPPADVIELNRLSPSGILTAGSVLEIPLRW